jgi:hypothetical protein
LKGKEIAFVLVGKERKRVKGRGGIEAGLSIAARERKRQDTTPRSVRRWQGAEKNWARRAPVGGRGGDF